MLNAAKAETMTTQDEYFEGWLEFARYIWGPDWAICPKTPNNLRRHSSCLTKTEYWHGLDLYRAKWERGE
jgi:hypothetical protein